MTDGWPSAQVAELAEWVQTRTGLTFPVPRREPAVVALIRAFRGGPDVASTIGRLEKEPAALDELLADLTIGETYFFRHPEQLEVVRTRVLPELARGRSAPLRIWSAGCATGEEPYSLAIMARESISDVGARVLGTDLSRARLTVARRGRYRSWSLRGVRDEAVQKYFHSSGPWYDLRPDIRSAAEFRYLNLVEDDYPSTASGVWGMDLILCRNVLIYLDRESVKRVANRLVDSLSETGWLFLGASDPMITELAGVEAVITEAGVAYRRASAKGGRPALPPVKAGGESGLDSPLSVPVVAAGLGPAPGGTAAGGGVPAAPAVGTGGPERPDQGFVDVSDPPGTPSEPSVPSASRGENIENGAGASPRPNLEELNRWYLEQRYEAVADGARELIAADEGGPSSHILRVRALANLGRMADAEAASLEALETERDSAELLYLHAMLLLEAGRAEEALEAARRALYLDQGMVMAHLAFADASIRLDRFTGAGRSLRNAERLLKTMPPDEIVPASDGEAAGRVLRMVGLRRTLLQQKAPSDG